MRQTKGLRLESKALDERGTFEGLLSPYGNIDSGADQIVRGAYSNTLKAQGNKRPLLWQHKPDVPIGELTLDDRPDGLWCKGQLLMALPDAQMAYTCIKNLKMGLSIGFDAVKDSMQNGIRILSEIRLYEGSIVTFPMNELAVITSVKTVIPWPGGQKHPRSDSGGISDTAIIDKLNSLLGLVKKSGPVNDLELQESALLARIDRIEADARLFRHLEDLDRLVKARNGAA